MTNLENTGEIIARQNTETIIKLINQRANAQPPRWMTIATRTVVALAVADTTAFAIHAATSRHRTGMGVTLGLHVALFAVLVLAAVHLAVGLARIRLDIRRTAEQDQLDTYRHKRVVAALTEISTSARQAKARQLIEDLQYDDETVVPFGGRARRTI